MSKSTNAFIWDREASFIETSEFSRKHPELHLFEVYHRFDPVLEYSAYVFAMDAKAAKIEARKTIFEGTPLKTLRTKRIKKCF